MRRLALCLCFALPVAALAQVAGHGSIPSTGAAVRDRHRLQRDDDPVLARIERIRSDLADVAKRYRKARSPDRDAMAQRITARLEEISAQVARLESED